MTKYYNSYRFFIIFKNLIVLKPGFGQTFVRIALASYPLILVLILKLILSSRHLRHFNQTIVFVIFIQKLDQVLSITFEILIVCLSLYDSKLIACVKQFVELITYDSLTLIPCVFNLINFPGFHFSLIQSYWPLDQFSFMRHYITRQLTPQSQSFSHLKSLKV